MSFVTSPAPAARPAARLTVAGACLAPAVLLLAWTVAPAGVPVALGLFAAGLGLAARGMVRGYPHARLGGANLVTTLRLGLTAAAAAALTTPEVQSDWTAWAPAGIAILALGLDGVDGWLARRQALSSRFGARYDMEVDSGLAAVLAAIVLARGPAGPELIVLGGARYAFAAAARIWPWLDAPLEDSLRRKAVCVIQIGTLVALAAPVFPDAWARPVACAAAALVAWSFAVDIRRLARGA